MRGAEAYKRSMLDRHIGETFSNFKGVIVGTSIVDEYFVETAERL